MAGPDLIVASVLWVGDFRKRNYTPDWVIRQRNMVARKLSVPHRYVCLTNTDVPGVETIPLAHDWPGWWAKLNLLRPGLFEGRVLYLDLDTLPTGSLDEIVSYPADIALMPPSYEFGGSSPRPSPKVVNRYQSSCMVWTPEAGREIYERFTPEVMERLRGDQDHIGETKKDCAVLPAQWFKKLKHCQKGPPEGVKLVLSMPWKCDVAARKFPWVRRLWK